MWNPAISSYTWERFKDDHKEMCEDGWRDGVGNWSVWEHELADEGDRFFMVNIVLLASVADTFIFVEQEESEMAKEWLDPTATLAFKIK